MNLIQVIKSRGLLWVSVHSLLFALDRFIEYYLYPASIIRYGLVQGTGLMMLLSLVLCYLLIKLYDWVSIPGRKLPAWYPNWLTRAVQAILPKLQDALGFETLKEAFKDVEQEARNPQLPTIRFGWSIIMDILLFPIKLIIYPIRRFILRPLWFSFPRTRDFLLFVNLSILTDPMTTLILMRPAHHHEMGRKEWILFLGSVVVSCTGWALLVWLGIESFYELGPYVSSGITWLVNAF